MLVLAGKPAITKRIEIVGAAGPEFIYDLAGIVAQRLAVRSSHRNLLRAEPLHRKRAQCQHQMHMRIARCIVIDPVGDHTVGRDMPLNELPDQGDVLFG